MADDIARVRAALGPVVPGELPQLSQVVGASAATPTNATARGRELVVPASDPARAHEVMRADWVVSEGDERVTERSLRAAAQSLERVAAELEEQHRYAEADRLWAASRGLRHAARNNLEKPSDSVENEQSPE
jgi:hypothetical protein